ncbi:MAG: hypothetical protein HZA54_05010 [Planctomycetes bacterium]|nr:hypothetical protein [Planctomycetota bacterium]
MSRRRPAHRAQTLTLGLVLQLLLSVCLAQAHHLHATPQAPTTCGAGLCGHSPHAPDTDDNPATCARCAFAAQFGLDLSASGTAVADPAPSRPAACAEATPPRDAERGSTLPRGPPRA